MVLLNQPVSLHISNYPTLNTLASHIVSVNFHLIKACNYRCIFCFAHFNQITNNYLPKDQAFQLVSELATFGTKKITFVGGEPTLVPYLPELVIHSKSLGMTTMIVTNGTKLTDSYLQQFQDSLDWVGLSIDSSIEHVSQTLGRGTGHHVQQTLNNAVLLKSFGIKIKLNTVVTKLTWNEDMTGLLEKVQPHRWKVFKMLLITGENDHAEYLQINDMQFSAFLEKHQAFNPVAETNEAMIDSYVMIDPEGRFFNNTGGQLHHGPPILNVGVPKAFALSNFQLIKLVKRGGIYEW